MWPIFISIPVMFVAWLFLPTLLNFSKLDFIGMKKIDIRDNMKEMFDNLDKCKYADCMHIQEDGCYIKKMVENNEILKSRYQNYLNFVNR